MTTATDGDDDLEDGFRPRRKRTKSDMKQLIKDGVVRDPNAPPEPDPVYGENVTVFAVPTATIDAEAKEVK